MKEMKEIDGVKEKLRNDERRRTAYEKYEKYEEMLKAYNNGIKLIPSTKNPFRTAGKIAQKAGFNVDEYERFCDEVDKILKKDPKTDLNDLSSKKGRGIIGDIISISQADDNFKNADLDSVAVAKYYGLYKVMDETNGKNNNEVVKILMDNKITIPVYEKAKAKVENYEKNNRRELYDRIRKDKPQNIVHMAAAVLEIGPGEAESSLSAFEMIKDKEQMSDFDKRLKIGYCYEEYKSDYELIERCKENIDIIIYSDNIGDVEKEKLIDEQRKIMERTKNKIQDIKSKRAEQYHIVDGKLETHLKRNGNFKGISEETMKRNGITRKNTEESEVEVG